MPVLVIPAPTVPAIDPKTGILTDQWYKYLNQNNFATNSTTVTDNLQAQITVLQGQMTTAQGDITTLQGKVANMGLTWLTAGTVTPTAATLDIVLTSYTAYSGIQINLSNFLPTTTGRDLWMRFSTDGGVNFDASGYNYSGIDQEDSGTTQFLGSSSAAEIVLTTGVVNTATGGVNATITLLDPTSATAWTKMYADGYQINSGSPNHTRFMSGGSNAAAQNTDAVRFMFSASSTIGGGNYAVYGLK